MPPDPLDCVHAHTPMNDIVWPDQTKFACSGPGNRSLSGVSSLHPLRLHFHISWLYNTLTDSGGHQPDNVYVCKLKLPSDRIIMLFTLSLYCGT